MPGNENGMQGWVATTDQSDVATQPGSWNVLRQSTPLGIGEQVSVRQDSHESRRC